MTKREAKSSPYRSSIEGIEEVRLEKLIPLQSEVKRITRAKLDDLKASILKYGFSAPFFGWRSSQGRLYILDGHQRHKALTEMVAEGRKIDSVPVVLIKAGSKREAKEILLRITSQYGEFSGESLMEFVAGLNVDGIHLAYGELSLKALDLDIDSFFKDLESGEAAKRIEKTVVCPKCGHRFTV